MIYLFNLLHTIILRCLIQQIQQVKQLEKDKQFRCKEILPKSTCNEHSEPTNIGPFEWLNIQSLTQVQQQQQYISVWPTMLYPKDLITNSFSHCNGKNYTLTILKL